MSKEELSEGPQTAIQRILETESATIDEVFQGVIRQELSLERAADVLEGEALRWASNLHHEILRQWALKAIPPDQFESIAREKAGEIAEFAAEHFSVACVPASHSPNTPLRIGQHPAVIEGSTGPAIDNRSRLKKKLLDRLSNYPRQFQRDNLFRYRTSLGPATAQSADTRAPEETAAEKPRFPKRAAWLSERLRERSWNKHDLSRQGGPDHKTIQKFLNGFHVREDVLKKITDALSKAPSSMKLSKVGLLDIPQD